MSATGHTTYYNLPQYEGFDVINPLVDTNDAYQKIDTALHTIEESATGGAGIDIGIGTAFVTADVYNGVESTVSANVDFASWTPSDNMLVHVDVKIYGYYPSSTTTAVDIRLTEDVQGTPVNMTLGQTYLAQVISGEQHLSFTLACKKSTEYKLSMMVNSNTVKMKNLKATITPIMTIS